MALLTPAWMQATPGDTDVEYSASADRAAVLGAMFSREGVFDPRGGQMAVTQRAAGANFTVDVAAGRAAILGDDISDQGTYVVTNTTTYSVTIPAPPASGTRTHRIIARVRDHSADASWAANTYDWRPDIVPDTGTGLQPEPDSAITLATVAVPAGAGSVTNAMITDLRQRATVGSTAIDGSFGALYEGFIAADPTRPLRWSVNPDGWVQLSGWCRWNLGNTVVPAGEQRTMGGTPLNDPAIKPPGIRDFPGATVFGAVHYAVFPTGTLYFRLQSAVTLTTAAWFSFDGCFYRI